MAFRTNAGRGSNGHGVALFATTAGTGATQLVLTTAPGTGGASPYTVSPTPVVTAKSGAGVTDTSFVGVVTCTLNVLSGSPVLSGTTTKTAVAGVADFSANGLTVTGAGTWTLTFSSGSLSPAVSATGTTTGPFLQFSTQPGGANSGSAFSPQPVVTAKLAGGSTDTSFVGNVTLAVNTVTGSHALGGTVTVAAVAGVATFSGVTDTGSGDGTLTASATGYSSATSASFTTAAGGGAQFSENWSSNTIDSAKWATTLSGTGAASAATGALVISLSAGGSAKVGQPGSNGLRYDLTTAGALANGVVANITGLSNTGARFYYALVGSDGAGWAFHYESGSLYWHQVAGPNTGTIESRLGASLDGAAMQPFLRFRKVGGNLEVSGSADGIAWAPLFGTNNTIAIGSETVTAMGTVFEVDAGGAAMSATIDNIVFN